MTLVNKAWMHSPCRETIDENLTEFQQDLGLGHFLWAIVRNGKADPIRWRWLKKSNPRRFEGFLGSIVTVHDPERHYEHISTRERAILKGRQFHDDDALAERLPSLRPTRTSLDDLQLRLCGIRYAESHLVCTNPVPKPNENIEMWHVFLTDRTVYVTAHQGFSEWHAHLGMWTSKEEMGHHWHMIATSETPAEILQTLPLYIRPHVFYEHLKRSNFVYPGRGLYILVESISQTVHVWLR